MPAFVLAALLAWSSPAVVSVEDPERVYSLVKYEVEADLEHIAVQPVVCRLRLLNRNAFAIRIDYRMVPKEGEPGPVSSVILRSRGGGERRDQRDWDHAEVSFPAGVDYASFEILNAVRGKVRERFGTRQSSTGVTEQYSELEFTEISTDRNGQPLK